jgi:hypothetical protein
MSPKTVSTWRWDGNVVSVYLALSPVPVSSSIRLKMSNWSWRKDEHMTKSISEAQCSFRKSSVKFVSRKGESHSLSGVSIQLVEDGKEGPTNKVFQNRETYSSSFLISSCDKKSRAPFAEYSMDLDVCLWYVGIVHATSLILVTN